MSTVYPNSQQLARFERSIAHFNFPPGLTQANKASGESRKGKKRKYGIAQSSSTSARRTVLGCWYN